MISISQDDSANSRQKKDAEANWKTQVFISKLYLKLYGIDLGVLLYVDLKSHLTSMYIEWS